MCLSLCRAAALSLPLGNAVLPLSRARRRPGLKHLQRFQSEAFSLWQQPWVRRRSGAGGARLAVPGWQRPAGSARAGPSPLPQLRPRPLRGCSGRRDAGDAEMGAGGWDSKPAENNKKSRDGEEGRG